MTAPAPPHLVAFPARVGDRNVRGMAGARLLGDALSVEMGVACTVAGAPEAPLGQGWAGELAAARPALHRLAAEAVDALQAGRRLVAATNRCSASLATLPAVARLRPDATVVWFDAHADANTPDTTHSGYLGGLVLTGAAGLWDSGLGGGLPLGRVVLVGARDIDAAEQALIDGGVLRHVAAGPGVAARLDALLGDGPVYVHVDCDVLDPGLVPTEYQVAGGLTLADLRAAAQVLARREVVGLEIAEFEATWPGQADPVNPGPLLHALAPLWEARA